MVPVLDIGPANRAADIWAFNFNKGPYTSFRMVDFLITRTAKSTWKKFLEKPELLQGLSDGQIVGDSRTLFDNLSNTYTGRCTSFALNCVRDLERLKPVGPAGEGYWDFKFYDLKGHRVARCEKTGVLIDSSSKRGAFVLDEGSWKSLDEEDDQRWKFLKGPPGGSGTSKFEVVRNNICVSDSLLMNTAYTTGGRKLTNLED